MYKSWDQTGLSITTLNLNENALPSAYIGKKKFTQGTSPFVVQE